MSKEKIKRFVKEHKKEIIVGSLCLVAGFNCAKNKYYISNDDRKLIETFNRINKHNMWEGDFKKAFIEHVGNASKVCSFKHTGDGGPMKELSEVIAKSYGDSDLGIGALVFSRKA